MNACETQELQPVPERGAISILVLVAAIPLLVAIGALLTVSVAHHDQCEQELGRTTAAITSFTGAQDALSRLEQARTLNGEFDLAVNGGTLTLDGMYSQTSGVPNADPSTISQGMRTVIPEPATVALSFMGLAAVLGVRRRRL